jgi:glycosyltransferase involved in cell wall biosynthesis
MIANTGTEMARAILELIENPAQRQSMERQARLTVERSFNWDVIARRQKQLYEELA